jgi:hypothetical protein
MIAIVQADQYHHHCRDAIVHEDQYHHPACAIHFGGSLEVTSPTFDERFMTIAMTSRTTTPIKIAANAIVETTIKPWEAMAAEMIT